jgi:uncharacterized lipoprotein YbaY
MQRFEASTFTGRLMLADGGSLPPGAVIELRLRDLDAAGTVVATRTLTPDPRAPVVLFSMRRPPEALRSGRRHGVEAQLLVEGVVRYRTPAPVPLDRTAPVELRLEPLPVD